MDKYIKRTKVGNARKVKSPITPSKKKNLLMKLTSPFRSQYSHMTHSWEKNRDWHRFINGEIKNTKPVISSLFSGYSFYFDGFLGEKTRLELVELVRIHSGNVEHFYTASHVNVIIAKNMCFSKERQFMKKPNIHVVDPQWILDSIEKKKLQSFTQYTILRDSSTNIDKYIQQSKSLPSQITDKSY